MNEQEMQALKEELNKITQLKLNKQKKGIMKGFKIAAVPFKLLNAMVHPRRTWREMNQMVYNFTEKHLGFDEPELTAEQLNVLNTEIEKELEPDVLAILANEKATQSEITPPIHFDNSENLTEKAPVAGEFKDSAPVVEATITPEPTVIAPTMTPEPVAVPIITNIPLSGDELIQYLINKELAVTAEIKSYKQMNKNGNHLIDEIIDLEDELETVKKQLKAEFERKELEERQKDQEVEEEIAINTPEIKTNENVDVIKNSIFTNMADFLFEIVEDKKVANMEIDEQIAILMNRKMKNEAIINEYSPYITANLKANETALENEQVATEHYSERDLKKAMLLSQINELKIQLSADSYNNTNETRKELAHLEGKLDGMNAVDSFDSLEAEKTKTR